MTRDDIIRMAREAGLGFAKGTGWGTHSGTQRFAALVAAAEREAIAKLADESVDADKYPTLTMLAAAIRMRGDK